MLNNVKKGDIIKQTKGTAAVVSSLFLKGGGYMSGYEILMIILTIINIIVSAYNNKK